jgi:hypothetical protein
MTKASISKSLLTFKDNIGLRLTQGKLNSARDTYRRSTAASIPAGTHFSSNRSKRKAA